MKIKTSYKLLELLLLMGVFFVIPCAVSVGYIGYFLAILLFALLVGINVIRISRWDELSITICIPIILSAFQNIGLGIFAPALSKTEVQFLTILNFLYALIIFVALLPKYYGANIKHNKTNRKIWNTFILLIVYSLFSIILLSNRNVLSIVSSARNIFSMLLFYFIGVLVSDRLSLDRFEKLLLIIGLMVVCVGLYEIIFDQSMWRALNITELWTKKGISVQNSGLPTNFYSSETINGHRIRRMTASFADPVNLGAYLFVIFMLAWFRKRKIYIWITLVAIALTVSKGAFLGILIFITIYAYYHYSKPVFIISLTLTIGAGMAFLLYASNTSANSVFLHISGLTAAFRSILRHPLGSGMGSNGVLARQFSSFSANREITESGLGMIIGQLGIPGLLLYIVFFVSLVRFSKNIKDERSRILYSTLLLSIIANMFFNEVALSPNSCAAYFLLIGFIVGSTSKEMALNTVREA